MRTKTEILQERLEEAYQTYLEAQGDLNHLKYTACGLRCASCREYFLTELDFANHYLVPNERYLNLGNCKNRYNNGVIMPALYNRWGMNLEEQAYQEDKQRNGLRLS